MGNFDSNRFKSTNQEWETPDSIFLPLNEEFHFTLDVAATSGNQKCPRFLTERDDALSRSWKNEVCWLNPPYKQVKLWIKKAYEESQKPFAATVVCLVQARTNTNWWHDYCMKGEVRFIRGRPKFKGCKHGLPQPLAIVIFRGVA